MPLTPEDVRSKRFTPVRLREGYDMGEVDQFLDEVETELERLAKEREDLQAKLGAAGTTPDTSAAVAASDAGPAVAPAPTMSIGEASTAATRLLEIAGRNADELVTEAKDSADKIIGEARTKAERLESEARSLAEQLESDAHSRSDRLDEETSERRQLLFSALDTERESLEQEVGALRTFEREYRSRLKAYFERQLQVLDGDTEVAASPLTDVETDGETDATPERLRSLLGDDAG
jgi:DivIVA domain-containing protein